MGATQEGGGGPFFLFSPSLSTLSAAHQLQLVVPEIEGRMVPLGEGLDPNHDI